MAFQGFNPENYRVFGTVFFSNFEKGLGCDFLKISRLIKIRSAVILTISRGLYLTQLSIKFILYVGAYNFIFLPSD